MVVKDRFHCIWVIRNFTVISKLLWTIIKAIRAVGIHNCARQVIPQHSTGPRPAHSESERVLSYTQSSTKFINVWSHAFLLDPISVHWSRTLDDCKKNRCFRGKTNVPERKPDCWWPIKFPAFMYSINSSRMNDSMNTRVVKPTMAIWRQNSGSTLAQVMACCLTALSHNWTNVFQVVFIVLNIQGAIRETKVLGEQLSSRPLCSKYIVTSPLW